MFPVSSDCCKILQENQIYRRFYYTNDLALNTTFTEIPVSLIQSGQHTSWSHANNDKYLMYEKKIISDQIRKSAISQVLQSQFPGCNKQQAYILFPSLELSCRDNSNER